MKIKQHQIIGGKMNRMDKIKLMFRYNTELNLEQMRKQMEEEE